VPSVGSVARLMEGVQIAQYFPHKEETQNNITRENP